MYKLIEDRPEFVIISKYPGIDFHRGASTQGLVEKIRADIQCKELFPLHRLDTMTSGLILFAKNRESVQELATQFREHSIDKFYIAIAGNNPHKKQGTIIGDMRKVRNGEWLLCHTTENPAITQFFSKGMGNGFRLYILRLLTGKTHQIRVALKSLGVPLLGDPIYSKNKKYKVIADRGYLHAYAIGFKLQGKVYRYFDLPDTGKHFSTEAFKDAMINFKDPWMIKWPRYPLNFPVNEL